MKGLIRKDILLTKSLLKSYIIIIIACTVMSITTQNNTLTTILPVFGVMICISTLSYDSYYKWDAFALTLPLNRKDCIRAKYLLAIIVTIALALIATIINIGANLAQGIPIDALELLTLSLSSILGAIVALSLSLPMMYKFGSENGRIIMFIVILVIGACIVAISELFSGVLDQTAVLSALSFLSTYFLPIIFISIIVIIAISYHFSMKIYLKKEF